MLLRDKQAVIVAIAATLFSSSLLSAGTLPVVMDSQAGDVRQLRGDDILDVADAEALLAGTTVFSGSGGRAEFSVNGAPSLSLGGTSALLFHSVEGEILRAALTSGSLLVDTRSGQRRVARDIRLNIGELRARILNARVWAQKDSDVAQICLLSGQIEFRVGEQPLQLDTPNQCVRQDGQTRQWAMVPAELMRERVASTKVPRVGVDEGQAASVPLVQAPPPPVVDVKPVENSPPVADAPIAQAPVLREQTVLVSEAVVEPQPEPLPESEIVLAPEDTSEAELEAAVALAAKSKEDEVDERKTEAPIEPAEPAAEPVKATPVEIVTVPSAKSISVLVPEPVSAIEPAQEAAPAEVSVTTTAEAQPVADEASVARAEQADPQPDSAAQTLAPAPTAVQVTLPRFSDQGRYWSIVLASMEEREGAEQEEARLKALGLDVSSRPFHVGKHKGYRVGVGRYETRERAQEALDEFSSLRPDFAGWLAKY